MKSGQEERTGLKSDVVSVTESSVYPSAILKIIYDNVIMSMTAGLLNTIYNLLI